jgi:hypothetical protein
LAWVARLEVVGREPLGLAMGWGRRATYSHVERLAGAGLLERVYDAEGSVVAVTRAGRRMLGLDGGSVPLSVTRGAGLRHARAVSWVAALLTVRERSWSSEQEMRSRADWLVPVLWQASRGTHRPDVGVEVAGRRVAIEVELCVKAPRRLRAILAGYEALIAADALSGGVVYVSDRDDVLAAVMRAAVAVGVPEGRLRTLSLSDMQRELYDRAQRARQPVTLQHDQRSGTHIALASSAVMR